MRNTLIGLLALTAVILFSFIAPKPPQERVWKLNLTDQQLNGVWDVINQSNAPHTQVVAVQNLIQQQLQGQNAPTLPSDSTRKHTDTTHTKKK